jgi:iron complex transport system ATP-binding protein
MDDVRLEAAELRTRTGAVLVGPVDLAIGHGERWALLGPNGSGKTSLLLLAGARRQPVRGSVTVLGERLGACDVRVLRRRIGHTSHRLADSVRGAMTVREVVLAGARGAIESWLTEFTAEEAERAQAALERVGCGGLADRQIGSCSQGERARVMLARALVADPQLLLLDEPCAGLDLPSRESLVRALDDPGLPTLVLATHHLEELPASTTHAALLREGRLLAAGPVAEVLTEARLGECFGMPLEISRHGGRYSARAAS